MFENAEAYERFMGRWSRLVAPLLVDFAGLPQQGRMLDVGSGTGSLSFTILERNPRARVVGIDPSREYVAYAMDRNPFPGQVTFEIGDAQELNYPDASFDAALSLLVFNFIPNPERALLEIRRVAKPGGKIAASVWDYGEGMRMLRTFWDAAVQVDPDAETSDEKHMPLCRAGELSALWTKGGLEDVSEQSIEISMNFESFEDYWEPFLLGQGPAGSYVRRLAKDRLQILRDEIKGRLPLSGKNTPLVFPARVWSVRGTIPNHGGNGVMGK